MRARLEGVGRFARRLPFTLSTLALLVVLAVVTNTYARLISDPQLARLGFAPVDVWTWRWGRLFTSLLVTSGAHGFWLAIVGVGLCAGAAERLAGSWRAALAFLGAHIVTLVVGALVVLALLQLGSAAGAAIAFEPDVGPSAGTFGCLGLGVARLPGRWRTVGGGVAVGVLFVILLLPLAGLKESPASISSNLAHLIAFPLGYLASGWGAQERESSTSEVRLG
jgi:hypothetical protein